MSRINFTLDLLAQHSFGRLASVLRRCNDAIMERWEGSVREVLPNADQFTMEQLRNSLPEIMEQMAKALESDQPEETLALVEMTKPHGGIRFQQRYSVRELAAEYRMWRRILFEEVWRGVDSPLSEEEVTVLNMAVDTALEGGMLAYIDAQRDQIQEAVNIESKYVAFLSHDLRNHFNHASLILQFHTQNLRQTQESEQMAQDLEALQKSIAGTMKGMERLLQAERLRKHAIEPKRERISLKSIAFNVAGEFAIEARDKGLALDVEVPADTTVCSDPEIIGLILQNLIGNAVKYSQRGRVRIDASPGINGSGWVMSVTDEGPGIPKDELERLFGAFERGQAHGQQGMGLGLAIAAEAAKLLGGEIKVESRPGQGTTFQLVVQENIIHGHV